MVRYGAGALPGREDGGGSWSFGSGFCGTVTVASLGWGGRSDGAGLRRRTRAVMVPALRAKAIHSGEMAAAPPDVALPVEGVILELQPSYTRSLGENPVQLLDERRRRLWASS